MGLSKHPPVTYTSFKWYVVVTSLALYLSSTKRSRLLATAPRKMVISDPTWRVEQSYHYLE
ncbi:hypothetical protein ACIQD3_05955 [Peribacillus loiseleuriae]|uniref:hypothetical protein n=1 Tax=Peribacillus loiseleuriae TaxID=1679170 RepID=UPI00381A5731